MNALPLKLDPFPDIFSYCRVNLKAGEFLFDDKISSLNFYSFNMAKKNSVSSAIYVQSCFSASHYSGVIQSVCMRRCADVLSNFTVNLNPEELLFDGKRCVELRVVAKFISFTTLSRHS